VPEASVLIHAETGEPTLLNADDQKLLNDSLTGGIRLEDYRVVSEWALRIAAIDEGRFADAMRLTAELELKLTPLAYAEDHIALRGGMILRAGNLKEGMKVQGFGTVQALTRIECEDHFHLDVDFAEPEASPMRLHEKQEVVVQVDDEQ
jgi:hypothetical protein